MSEGHNRRYEKEVRGKLSFHFSKADTLNCVSFLPKGGALREDLVTAVINGSKKGDTGNTFYLFLRY